MQMPMEIRLINNIHFLLALVFLSIVLTLTSSLTAFSQNDSLSPENRSTTIFCILKDAGIKFENTRMKALRLIEVEEYSEARNLCNSFVKDMTAVLKSLEMQVGLTKNDVRYVNQSLAQLQRKIDRLLNALPLGY